MDSKKQFLFLGLRLYRSWGGLCAFWFDYWIRGVSLSVAYPRIAAAAQVLGSNVFDLCSFDGRWSWSIPLTTTLRGGALLEFEHLMRRLDSLPVDFLTAGPTSIIWPLETSSVFSVRSMRAALACEKFPGVIDFPAEVVWSKCVPTKVQAFVWMVYYKKVATVDNLQRRGMQMPNRCVLCYSNIETVNHILLHCSFTIKVWNLISSVLSIYGPSQGDIRDVIRTWKGMNCSADFAVAMKALLHGIC
ncbi:Putative ribonuclease H protein At1g65750 [Linum grandiflorum]